MATEEPQRSAAAPTPDRLSRLSVDPLPRKLAPRAVPGRGQTFVSRDKLTAAGFTEAQASGAMMGDLIKKTSHRSRGGTHEENYQKKLVELKNAGFTPAQLCDAGFPAKVLRGAGFTLAELMEAGGSISFLREVGFRCDELMQAGFTALDLKDAGVDAAKLRMEAHVEFQKLREVGFTAHDFRACGFGPRELIEAGFVLKEIKEAGFSAAQLGRKGGFTLKQLRMAGFTALEVLSVGKDVGEAELRDAGFSNQQIKMAFTGRHTKQSDGKDDKGLFALALSAKEHAKEEAMHKQLRPDGEVKARLSDLLTSPPLREVMGPSKRVYGGLSLCCLKPGHEPRRTAIFLVESAWFDPCILFMIILNCITMAWESKLDPPGTSKALFINYCEWIFLIVFTIEMLSKILAYGFLSHKHAYLRDSWCQLDFIVVTLAWMPILTSLPLANYSVVRSVRALRPLRALKRVPGMPMLVQSTLAVLPRMGSVSMLCAFIFLVFGIVGTELFQGALHYRCATPSNGGLADTEVTCNPTAPNQCAAGDSCSYFEENPEDGLMSFDNVPMTFVILLEGVTFDDWATPMYALMSAVSPYVIIYFILIVVLGGFFVINLFLAVIFEEFISQSRIERAVEAMDVRSPRSVSKQGTTSETEPTAPPAAAEPLVNLLEPAEAEHAKRPNLVYKLATSSALNNLSILLVIVNMVVMCLPFYGMPTAYESLLDQCSAVITYVFIAEMIVKLLGLGCQGYWTDGWNALDGSIVLMSIAEIIITDILFLVQDGAVPKMSFLRILRMLRVARVLRLMRGWTELHKILMTFLKIVPQMANLFVLTFLVMVILALLGMEALGGIFTVEAGFSPLTCPGGECPDGLEEVPHYHFDYFGPAMSTVFILMTGEWIDATYAAASAVGVQALAYFIPAMLVSRYFIMNLFLGILLNGFADDSDADTTSIPAPAPAPATSSAPEPAEDDSKGAPSRWRDYSLFLFAPKHPIRRLCRLITSLPAFDPIVMVVIIASSVCLGLDSPRLHPQSSLALMLHALDGVWTTLFVVEMGLKVVAQGFVCGKTAYLKSTWNQLDFAIVLCSLLVLAAEAIPQLHPLRFLRILRVLRPLRLVSRSPGMKLIVSSLIKALPAVSNVFFVVLALQSVFAILGMQLFMGEFASCTDPSILTKEECFNPTSLLPLSAAPRGLSTANLTMGRALKGGQEVEFDGTQSTIWTNPGFGSFDNFGDAMLLLYIMSSGDEWEAPMYSMMAATAPGLAPVRNDYSPAAFFSILWMFVGSFVALNLFVGVIVDSFDKIKKESDSSATMTPEQQQWVHAMQMMVKQKPSKGVRMPTNSCRRLAYAIVTSSTFDAVITSIIVVNIGVMACNFWKIEENATAFHAFNTATRAFTWVYYVECAIKNIALGPVGYLSDGWNRFDFFLVCTAAADDLAEGSIQAALGVPPLLLRVLRVFRILRILRLLKSAKELRDLIITTILSFPSLVNVASLLVLVVFVYAVLGVNMFTFLALQENIDEMRNFETLGSASLLLFQVLTGDAWSGIMSDAMVRSESGLCSSTMGNCGTKWAIPYFISFQVFGTYVFLNLVVAVILESFSSLGNLNPDMVSAADVEAFKEAWVEFDPDADNYIPSQSLPALVISLPPPMGLKGVADETKAVKFCLNLSLTQYEGQVAFQDVLSALTKYSFRRAGGNLDELDALAPASVNPPPLPISPSVPNVDKFQLGMPSARQIFAIKVIEKYIGRLMERRRQALIERAIRPRRPVAGPSAEAITRSSPGSVSAKRGTAVSMRQCTSGGIRSVRGKQRSGRETAMV